MTITCDCVSSGGGFTNLAHGTDHQWWVHVKCGRPTRQWLLAQGDEMLNLFKGGPIDGAAYATSTLLDRTQGHIPIEEYQWTPEVVVSQKTGASARVWLHNSQVPASPKATAGVPAAAGQSSSATPPQEGSTMAQTQSLEDRRKSLGLSRNQVAEQAGLTVAKIHRIEKGGPRTTEEETKQVTEALDALEAANAEEPAADPS